MENQQKTVDMYVQTNMTEKKREILQRNKGKHDNNATKAISEKRKISQKEREEKRWRQKSKTVNTKNCPKKMLNAKLLKRQNSINTNQEESYREMTVKEKK